MNARQLGILGGIALLVIIAAVWMGHSRSPASSEAANLYPALKGKLNDVNQIAVYKPGDQAAVTLTKDGAKWTVKERNSYAADLKKVNSLLIGLEDAKLREQKTANPQSYSALGVQDMSDAAAGGVRLELKGAGEVNLIVGKRDTNAHSTYVRRAGDPQSWLIGTELDVPADPTQWLDRELLNIGADRIQQVETQVGSAAPYSVLKKTRADANFDVKPIPGGRELNSVAAPNGVAQALSALQLEDVRPLSEVSGEKSAAHAVFRTFDGLVVDCVGYVNGDRRWVVFKTSFDPDLAKRFQAPTQPPSKETSDSKEPAKSDASKPFAEASMEAAVKKVQEEATALGSKLSGWAYAIPGYKYEAIFKPLDDLLKKPELPKKK